LVEFTKGFEPSNPVLFNEVYVYVFDATPMFLALLLLSLVHPGLTLVGPDSEFPRIPRKEKKEQTKCSKKKAMDHAKVAQP
jgi:hypothetical protein